MRDMNEFGKYGAPKRHNSLDGIKKTRLISKQYNEIQSQYGILTFTNYAVSETEEELLSDEEDKHNRRKKVFSLSQFSRLMNKKIYSDEFDMSFESKKMQKRFKIGSVVESPINEDIECED